ncbi:MAG: non-ribosomal peptide synthetase [Chthoniobacterales bacterium]
MKDRLELQRHHSASGAAEQNGQGSEFVSESAEFGEELTFRSIKPATPLRVEPHPTEWDKNRTIAIYPAAPGQLQMWFLQQYAPESPCYNIPMAFRLAGPLDVSRLEAAFQSVLRRHATLRTTFAMETGKLVQRVASSVSFKLQLIELAKTAEHEREAAARRFVDEFSCRPFGLRAEPQIRVQLIRLAAGDHFLLIVIHHIVSDGWSQANLCQELSALYATSDGAKRTPRALPIQFADYSAWQNEGLEDSEIAGQRAFWKRKLGDELEPLGLPTDHPRPTVSSFRGAELTCSLDPKLMTALASRAQAEGVTLFMLLLTAFKVLLRRYTGRDDVRVGVPFANRPRVETEELIGFFVNTLVMRTSVSGDPTFKEFVRRVKETAIEAYAHSDLPFENLVEMFGDQSGGDRPALVETLFALQDLFELNLSLEGLQVTPWPVHTHTAKMDLSLFVNREENGWSVNLEYNTDLFDADRIERMLGHWQMLLESVAANPALRISEMPLLTAGERHQLLIDWNQTAREYPRDKSVHQLFAEQAAATPDAVAVLTGEMSLTYRELNEKADQLAGHLRDAGVNVGDLVGLNLERSIELVIGVLGILKAGAAYWAIEEKLPDERMRMLVAEARPRLILARKSSADRLAGLIENVATEARVAAIDDLLGQKNFGQHAEPIVRADDVAYVTFTSGSTGRPKGVRVRHRGVVRLVKNANYVSLDASETILQMAPFSFDASTFELWGALLNGGRAVLMPPGQPSIAEIGAAIREHEITTIWLTAGLFHLMVDKRLSDLKSLRQFLAGGDVLSPEHVREARRVLPNCRIINGYGPTENTTFTCCYSVADNDNLDPSVPIGRPISNTQVYVLDGSLQPVPIGIEGELFAGGDGVALDYLGQPQLTAERFIPDPFSTLAGARLYRTGDRVRWRADGNLEFRGRLDSEIKIRGYRVDPREIETRLLDCAGIREAAVVVRRDESAEKILVAYVVLDEGTNLPVEGLRDHARNCLPDYMVPAAFVVLVELPLLPNGKINRHALPTPPRLEERAPNEQNQPLSLLEVELTRIWQSLFGRNHIGRQDNFFALGGHSLLAARLIAEVAERLGCKLPIATLFHAPTIETLSRRLTEEDCAPAWASLVPLQPEGTKPPLFFSHGWGGNVFCFQPLAHLLPPDQPSYGLQAVGLDGKTVRHTSIEEMAAHYVEEIRSFQPEGPYYLAGYSMGGLIAFEIGQQLFRLGQRVAMLALLDTARREAPWTVYARTLAPFLWRRCQFHFERWRQMPTRDRFHYLLRCWSGLYKWIQKNRLSSRVITAPPPKAAERPAVPGFDDYYVAVAEAYRLRRYPGTIDFFMSDTSDPLFVTLWRHLARGGAEFHPVPGTHLEIMGIRGSNQVPVLAKTLEVALDRAQRDRPS